MTRLCERLPGWVVTLGNIKFLFCALAIGVCVSFNADYLGALCRIRQVKRLPTFTPLSPAEYICDEVKGSNYLRGWRIRMFLTREEESSKRSEVFVSALAFYRIADAKDWIEVLKQSGLIAVDAERGGVLYAIPTEPRQIVALGKMAGLTLLAPFVAAVVTLFVT
jgi:hypothetical protein